MATYGSLTDLKARLKALTRDDIDAESDEETLATRALADANNIIKRVILSRGYTVELADTWTERDSFTLDIAVYLYAQRSGWEKRSTDEVNWLKNYNRIEELKTLPLILEDGNVLKIKVDEKQPALSGVDLSEIYEE